MLDLFSLLSTLELLTRDPNSVESSTSSSMEPSPVFISIFLGQLKVITLVFVGFVIRPIAAAAASTLSSYVKELYAEVSKATDTVRQ